MVFPSSTALFFSAVLLGLSPAQVGASFLGRVDHLRYDELQQALRCYVSMHSQDPLPAPRVEDTGRGVQGDADEGMKEVEVIDIKEGKVIDLNHPVEDPHGTSTCVADPRLLQKDDLVAVVRYVWEGRTTEQLVKQIVEAMSSSITSRYTMSVSTARPS